MAEEYISGTHSVAFVTVPDMDVARKIAHGAVEKKLASSVNIVPSVTSVYFWQGQVEEKPELFMVVKTASEKIPEFSAFVRENHPYICPQVISMKIEDGNPAYLKWIGETVSRQQTSKYSVQGSEDQGKGSS